MKKIAPRVLAALAVLMVLSVALALLSGAFFPAAPAPAPAYLRPDDIMWEWHSVLSEGNSERGILQFDENGDYLLVEDWINALREHEQSGVSLDARQGYWEIVDDSVLRLTIISETHSVGGEIVIDYGIGKTVEGEEHITTQFDPPLTLDYDLDALSPMYSITEDGALKLTSIVIDGQRYFKVFDADYLLNEPYNGEYQGQGENEDG